MDIAAEEELEDCAKTRRPPPFQTSQTSANFPVSLLYLFARFLYKANLSRRLLSGIPEIIMCYYLAIPSISQLLI